MTELFVFRHGPAVDVGTQGVKADTDRMLSRDGIEKTRRAAGGLKAIGWGPRAIFSSPLVRARETAELVAEVFGIGAVEETEFLCPGADTKKVIKLLAAREEGRLMVVGHMPDLAVLVSTVLVGDAAVDIVLKKASCCLVEFDKRVGAGDGRLMELLQPARLRQLAG